MKKIVALILALSMIFILCGCSKEEDFNASYSTIYDELKALKEDCDTASAFNLSIWETSGVNNFWNIYNAVRIFENDDSLEKLKNVAATTDAPNGWRASVWCAACGVLPNEYSIKKGDVDFTEEELNEIIAKCIEINTIINRISDREASIKTAIDSLREEYGKNFSEKIDALSDLYIECSLYSELVLEPSGTLNEYRENENNFDNNISRLLKTGEIA